MAAINSAEVTLKGEILNTEMLFGQLWEISVDGMRLIDEDGIILLVNDAFCKIFNMPQQELIGYPFSKVYCSDEQEQALKSFQSDIKSNQLKTRFERENTLWNNKKLWLEFSNSFLTLPDGKKITLSVIKDITERKKSEIELRESENKFKMLFNNANDAVFVTQLSDGKTYGDFVEVNEIACQRLGYSKEEFLLLSPSAIIFQKNIEDYNNQMALLLDKNHIIYETVHKAKDKRLFPVEVNSHLFNYNNQKTVLSIARDITERKKAEEKLKKTSKLLRELASHLQSVREEERTLISREIHDELGQVLTALKIQISLIGSKLTDEQSLIKQKINSTLKLIDNSVESVQKISSQLRPGILDELGLIAAMEWQIDEFTKLTSINSTVVILPDYELNLDAQKSNAIFRIFQEALTNVARHSGADKIKVSLTTDKAKLLLEISDNGKGISQNQIKDYHSLGIHGMKERAMVFGGSVYLEGIEGKGTTVRVEIPIS